jgi:hypothetical protein
MNVVAHQAVGIDEDPQPLLPLCEFLEVDLKVTGRCEDDLPVVASLDDVVRMVGQDDAGVSRHRHRLRSRSHEHAKTPSTPRGLSPISLLKLSGFRSVAVRSAAAPSPALAD